MESLDRFFETGRDVGTDTESAGRRAPNRFASALGALAFVLLVASIVSPPAAHAAFPGVNGKIAFTSN